MQKFLKARLLSLLIQAIPLGLILMIAIKNAFISDAFYITTRGNSIIGSQISGVNFVIYFELFCNNCFLSIYQAFFNAGFINSTYIVFYQLVVFIQQLKKMGWKLTLLAKFVRFSFTPFFFFNDLFILNGENETAMITAP